MTRANPFALVVGGELSDAVVEGLVDHLRNARRPMSLPELCNVLWLERGDDGYGGVAASALFDDIPTVRHGTPLNRHPLDPQPAVALGSLIKIEIGDEPAYAEVVWKEGAHQSIDEASAPAWLAGAPANADLRPDGNDAKPGTRVLRERLVLDFDCFGPGFGLRSAMIVRARERGLKLDQHGHLIIDAEYAADEAELDDVVFWAVATHRACARGLAAIGIEPSASDLADAASLIGATLISTDAVRSFGPYLIHEQVYGEYVAADELRDGSLRRAVRGLARLSSHQKVGWASMSARLVSYIEPDALDGPGWATAVTCASLSALDLLSVEAPTGDWDGIHLRLDDGWQGGGLWRAERLDGITPVRADPAIALGLGWLEHIGGEIERQPHLAPDDELLAPAWYADQDDDPDWDLQGSEVVWTLHVTSADIDTNRFRLPAGVRDLVRAMLEGRAQNQLAIRLRHDGMPPSPGTWAAIGHDGHLDFEWPIGILPGVTVRVLWPMQQTVITAETRLLPEPELVSGIPYTHEFNLRVALAGAGVAEAGSPTVSIRQLVVAAVRRHGAVTEDGVLVLTIDEITTYCFGPDGEVAPDYQPTILRRAVEAAVTQLVVAGAASRRPGGLVAVEEAHSNARRRVDRDILNQFVEATKRYLRQKISKHWVPPTIVNLPEHHRRSAAKDESWVSIAGTDGLPLRPLAPNQTWRRGHIRGTYLPAEVTDELDRTRQKLVDLTEDDSIAADLDDAVADPYANSPQQEDADV